MNKVLTNDEWQKLVWDCSFNSLGTVENKNPRELLSDSSLRSSLVKLMLEVIRVGHKLNIDFPDNFVNYNLKISYEMTEKVSILEMIESKIQPDIEVYNGYVVNMAKEYNVRVTENQKLYEKLQDIIAKSFSS